MNFIKALSNSPDDVWYVTLYFVIYLGSVVNTFALLKMGGIKGNNRLVFYIPLLYFPSIYLQGDVKGANVGELLRLTSEWTIPAAIFGYLIGLSYQRAKKRKEDSDDDSDLDNGI
jgi:hypothetical protein